MCMKQMKKGAKIAIIIAVAVVVLAAAFAVTAWLCGWFTEWFGNEDAVPADVKLYYNIDKEDYVSKGLNGMSSRGKRKDGYYHIKMATGGEQLDVLTDDVYTVEVLDQADVIGLLLDENNVVQEYYQLSEMNLWFLHGFVEKVDGNTFTFNTSGAYDGVQKDFTLDDSIPVINVGGGQMFAGYAGKIGIDDAVKIVLDKNNTVQIIYTEPYEEPAQVYWNYDRKWDSTLGISYREMNELGYYEFNLASNGDSLTVKTRDMSVASTMDANRILYLTFDEDGFVSSATKVASGWNGDFFAENITENSVDCLNNSYELRYSFSLKKGYQVYDVSAGSAAPAAATTLQRGDRCCYFKNSRNQVYMIYVVYRESEASEVLWNIDRKYDSNTKMTTREPDADGWYRMQAAGCGRTLTIKTKDKYMVQTWDSFVCRAVKLGKDNVIEKVYVAEANLQGGYVWGSYYYIDSIEGNKIAASRPEKQDITGVLADNYVAYNVSYWAGEKGEKTTLKVGDRVHCWTNMDKEVCYIFVVGRSLDLPIAWNTSRQYDSDKNETTRVPEADGKYVFTVAMEGEYKTIWTKDKEIANKVDSYNAPVFCVELSKDNEIIRCAGSGSSVAGSGGSNGVSWTDVTKIAKDGTVTTVKNNSTDPEKNGIEHIAIMTKNTKVYNVSGAYIDHKGEETTLQVGDMVHAICNRKGEATHIFIVGGRTLDLPLCWNVSRKYNSTTKETTRTPDGDGKYVFDIARNGELIQVWTKDKKTASTIDSYNAPVFALALGKDNEVKRVVGSGSVASGIGGSQHLSWTDVTKISGGYVTAVKNNSSKAEENGKSYTAKLAKDYVVYVVSDAYTGFKGEKTDLRVGDQIHVLCNKDKEITTIYVVAGRTLDLPLCWNVNRQYDSTKNETKRTPDGDGKYVFDIARNGELIQVWTKDKKTASTIDSYNAPVFALALGKDNEVKRVVGSGSVASGIGGSQHLSWTDVTKISGGYVTAVKNNSTNAEENGKVYTAKLAKDYAVYNVTGYYTDHKGEKTDLRVGDQIHVLCNKNKEITTIYVVSGRSFEGMEHGSHTSKLWTPWDGTADITGGGNYYLTKDVEVTSVSGIKFATSTTVNICLNGHNITGEGRFAWLSSGSVTVSVDDCKHCGKISTHANVGDDTAGGVVRNGNSGSAFKAYNITIEQLPNADSTYTVVKEGGLISCSGMLTLKNCTLKNGHSKKGGNILFAYAAQATIENCTISGGTCTGNGGNIHLTGSAAPGTKVTISDTVITGGSATGNGAGIFVQEGNYSNLTLKGKVTVDGNNVSNLYTGNFANVNFDGIAEDSVIGVTGSGTICENGAAKINCFKADNESYRIAVKDNALIFEVAPTHLVEKHCVCGGLGKVGDHFTCTEVKEWTALSADCFVAGVTSGRKAFKDKTGYYYVPKGGFTLPAAIEILPDQNITICLNGQKLECYTSEKIRVYGTINISDCSENAAGQIYSSASYASVFYCFDGAVINQYGGTLTASKASRAYGIIATLAADKYSLAGYPEKNNGSNGCVTYNMYGGAMDATNSGSATSSFGSTYDLGGALGVWKKSVFYMYGGTITGGTAAGKAGNVYIQSAATFDLYGGTISNGSARNGGNIYCAGTFNMHGGTVSGGKATVKGAGSGGNIFIASGAIMNMDGGKVTAGSTNATMGGNIMNEGTLTISGEAEISGGSTSGGNSGGNISNSGTVTITGGTIKGGYASEGGNLYNTSTAKTMTLKNCTVTGGVATGLGGGIRYKNGTLVLGGDVVIKDNTDKNGASNICIGNSKQITVDVEGMGSKASVGVNFGDTTTSGTIGAISSANGFTSDSNNLMVAVSGTNLVLKNKTLSAGFSKLLSALLAKII